MIPDFLFEDRTEIYIRLPYCQQNEEIVQNFINRFDTFTSNSCRLIVVWNTRKVKTLFPLKDKNIHKSCVIYEGSCSCGVKYIGETKRNATIRWSEHTNPRKDSEVAQHLYHHSDHEVRWSILRQAPKQTTRRRVLESYFISMWKPALNDQVDFKKCVLFKNGIT